MTSVVTYKNLEKKKNAQNQALPEFSIPKRFHNIELFCQSNKKTVKINHKTQFFLTVEISRNRDRTDMVLLPADFESTASTNSAMRPILCRILKKRILQVNRQKHPDRPYREAGRLVSICLRQTMFLIPLRPQSPQDLRRIQGIRNLQEGCRLHIHIRIIHI